MVEEAGGGIAPPDVPTFGGNKAHTRAYVSVVRSLNWT